MKYLILLFLVFFINCKDAEDYYDCLDKLATPKAKEVISNIKNHKIKENLPIIYDICCEQAKCAFTVCPSSLNLVRDYIYKDIYQQIFQQDKNLLSLHEFYWNMRDDPQAIEKCHSLFDNKIECKELIDSFNDWMHKEIFDDENK